MTRPDIWREVVVGLRDIPEETHTETGRDFFKGLAVALLVSAAFWSALVWGLTR